MCECRFFRAEDFPAIAKCFDEAFADYQMKSTRKADTFLYNRCAKNSVAWDYSVGVFAEDRLVGFTLIGLAERQGRLNAFDAGTGLVPDYRAQGLAREMFAFALPKLRESGCTRFLLEALQDNEPAIKAYTKTGFSITRELDCFRLTTARLIAPAPDAGLRIEALDRRDPGFSELLESFRPQLDWEPSWENSFTALRVIPDDLTLLGAFRGEVCVGLLAYYPLLNWILQILVHRDHRRRGIGGRLVAQLVHDLGEEHEAVSLTNIDHSDGGMIAFLKTLGFELVISQYEMAMDL
ncbi:MAG: GNAT family N-acetyltransferase [bacterium]|nr:GNAT family N-acetyltransferase [bacterium]